MVEVYATRINETLNENTKNKLISFISVEERIRIENFHFKEDAKRTLYGYILSRYLACKKLKVPNSELLFYRNEYGKPLIEGANNFFLIYHIRVIGLCV